MDRTNFRKKLEEDGANPAFQSLGWVINKQISELGVNTMIIVGEIDNTFPEYDSRFRKLSKTQNALFYNLRDILRKLIYVSQDHLIHKRQVTNAKDKIKDMLALMNRPYGSYDIRTLTEKARDYYSMLVQYDLIPAAGYYEENVWRDFRGQG